MTADGEVARPVDPHGGLMEHGRLIIDADGVEWEVYDESQWTITWALDWEYPPQTSNPGLIFDSPRDRRRLYPCPRNWQALSDAELTQLLERASSLAE